MLYVKINITLYITSCRVLFLTPKLSNVSINFRFLSYMSLDALLPLIILLPFKLFLEKKNYNNTNMTLQFSVYQLIIFNYSH